MSVTEGITFDYDTPGSFFRAGLQLLLAEEDNINRSIEVKGGIYTAKAKEGRYVFKNAPFGILKCHCGNPLSGAPSRGKSGKYFYYYKCKHSKHNNISAIKAHNQFVEACELMSLPSERVAKIRTEAKNSADMAMEANRKKVFEKKKPIAGSGRKTVRR